MEMQQAGRLGPFRNGDGAVYTMTNDMNGRNAVVMLGRDHNGSLHLVGAFATEGSGAGIGKDEPYADPLGSQHALIASRREHGLLFAVNAGSDEISVFRMLADGLSLLEKVSSGGNFPVSLALHGDLLYVLNAGGDGTIMGFSVQPDGRLLPLEGSKRSLGVGGTEPPYVFQAPGDLVFSPDGSRLVVVEKGIRPEDHNTHKLHVFAMDAHGRPNQMPATTVSHGHFPFAATFTHRGQLLAVEVFGRGPVETGTGAVSSYQIGPDGSLQVISGTVDNQQGASCWIVAVEPYVYVTNFASHTVTGYRVDERGYLELLNPAGVTAMTGMGSHPVDLAASPDGRFLYVLLPGTSQVAVFAIHPDGSLTQQDALKGMWPIGVQGLALA